MEPEDGGRGGGGGGQAGSSMRNEQTWITTGSEKNQHPEHPPSTRAPFQYPEVRCQESPWSESLGLGLLHPQSLGLESPGLGSFFTEPKSRTLSRQMDLIGLRTNAAATFHRFNRGFIDMQDPISEQLTDAFREIEFVGSRGRPSNTWITTTFKKKQRCPSEHPPSTRAPFQHPELQCQESPCPESPGPESPGPGLIHPESPGPESPGTERLTVEQLSDAFSHDMQDPISEQPTDAFGEIEFVGSRGRPSNFLRLSCDTDPKEVYKLITDHWNFPSPNLVVSVVEGEGREEIKPWVRDFLRNSLVRAAQSTGAWILTDGLRRSVARCMGEAVRDYKVVAPALPQKVMVVGVAPWGMVHNRERLVNPQDRTPPSPPGTGIHILGLDVQDFGHGECRMIIDDPRGWRGDGWRAQITGDDRLEERHMEGGVDFHGFCKKNPEECEALNKNVEDPSPPKSKQSFLVSRWKQFWFDPVTCFLGNVLMYFLFLCLFAYILLVDFKPPPPKGPSISEYVLYFWVFTFMCEEIRQLFLEDRKSMIQRLQIYIMDDWNKVDLTAIFLFLLALCCRMFSPSYKVGRAMMALDFVVFTVRLLHIFSIHRVLGPKIVMVRRMMKDLFFFLFFLAVWLIAYGVANKALLYSYDPSPIRILNQVFYQPYMYIFGQFPDINMDAGVQEEGKCTTNATLIEAGHEPCPNTYANWLVIILYIIYLLFTNIVLVNLLIAMFSHTFTVVQERSDIHWKYLRYNLIMEYYFKPYLAPPFIIISHLQLFIKRFIRDIPSVHRQYPALELGKKKASRLYRWEANQKENLLSAQNKKQRESDSAQLRSTSVRVDSMLKQMAEIHDQNRRLKSELVALSRITEALCQSGRMLPRPTLLRTYFNSR
ncbi:transient receptor potential cation channel subfamily M member 4-like [Cheilinus undulatus]|uniref:transient receptor potential cation channel subfamily M member 4-like n=1 Tax=Cheilinus undulatus TaxID=241271 RepID=UPI001BD274FF|nr:transient receptor potential cation channel subfamily M member 4-like [Cheilinus undulatus]